MITNLYGNSLVPCIGDFFEFQMNENNSQGKHTIVVPAPIPEHCGLIPMDGKAMVSTSGLKWNLTNQPLR